jgi:hypothetical protein
MVSNVINQPIGVVAKFNAIAKIRKYGRLHEGHHFIPMTMEVHDAPRPDMDHFVFFTIDDWEVIYPCLFAFNFSCSMLVLLSNVL